MTSQSWVNLLLFQSNTVQRSDLIDKKKKVVIWDFLEFCFAFLYIFLLFDIE